MSTIVPRRPNPYTGNPLDRAAHLRADAAWIAARLADPASRFVPFWRGRNLLGAGPDGAPSAAFLTGLTVESHHWAFLGLHRVEAEERAIFVLDVSAAEDPAPLLPEGAGSFEELRAIGPTLPPDEAAILAHARGLMLWRSRHRFCGVCGGPCAPQSAGHVMACTQCGTHHFPRTDPAVIMLITQGDRALLGRSARFAPGMYSTLAGFVEPGESLEEAVAREVLEESGITVGRVTYHSSQPWPFPASIMLGFYGEALTDRITIDPAELDDAQWFTRDQIRAPENHGFSLPRPDSIARRLIEDWIHG
ncbi:MAG TPA: NAD(+) diphosphatase [Acetobacteraceae bacterium]